MAIEFPGDVTARIHKSLKAFCLDEFGEDLGELRVRRVYEHLVGLVAAAAYNQGVADAAAWMQGKILDLEGDLHEQPPRTTGA